MGVYVFICEKGENGIIQLPGFWHRNSAFSLTLNQAHSFVSVFSPFPASTLCMSKLSACQQHIPPKFYLRWGCVSTSLTYETSAAWTCYATLGEVLTE